MSIASEIQRLQTDKADIAAAIRAKGVTVSSASGYDDFARLIGQISTGGGASNFVMGKFTTNASSGAQAVSLAYTGSGYPIAAMVFPSAGVGPDNPGWYTLVKRYAVGFWAMHKYNPATAPSYTTSGANNYGHCLALYKTNATEATTYTRTGSVSANTYSSGNAAAGSSTCVKFKSATSMSVYVAASSYGLVPSLEYTYIVVYSS